jgi:hypothetical protein
MNNFLECVRKLIPGHWGTEVEGNGWEFYVLAYPSKNSRYTLVIRISTGILEDGYEIVSPSNSSLNDLFASLESKGVHSNGLVCNDQQ